MSRAADLRLIEANISVCVDHLISVLDAIHGDPDLELEPVEDCDQDIDEQMPLRPDVAHLKRIRRTRP